MRGCCRVTGWQFDTRRGHPLYLDRVDESGLKEVGSACSAAADDVAADGNRTGIANGDNPAAEIAGPALHGAADLHAR